MKLLTILNQLCSQKNDRNSSVLRDLRRIFVFNNIPFYDPCCGDDNLLPAPVRFSGGVLEYFNGTSFVAVPASGGGSVGVGTFGMFYGLTAGTGNGGASDYASTVAVKTSVGTGRVPFPRSGPTSGSATSIDGSSFTLPNVGTYEIIFTVHTTEAGQLQIELNGADVADSVTPDMNPTSGGHLYVGHVIITTTTLNSVLAIVNADGNAAALTITPANGSETHANAQRLIIKQIA